MIKRKLEIHLEDDCVNIEINSEGPEDVCKQNMMRELA